MPKVELDIPTARWTLPLLEPKRYRGAKGGRASGKSHHFAERAVEDMVADPGLRFVCIREIQRTLQFSAKSVIESKIRSLGVSDLFVVLKNEIRRRGGTGIMIFEGMQDHTADSIKSLEDFGRVWVEEAQSLSKHSLELLEPTIRSPGSELWFSWNPVEPDDPVELLFRSLTTQAGVEYPETTGVAKGEKFVLVHNTYRNNPFVTEESVEQAERMAATDTDAYEHIWLGGYDVKSDAKVLAGKYVVDEFEPDESWSGPYFGADHGFALDPRTLVKCWIGPHRTHGRNCLYIERESYHVKLGIDKTAEQWGKDVPGFDRYVVRVESAEPGTNDYLKRNGVPKLAGVDKWKGSIEDGVAHLRHYDRIIIHPRCVHTQEEARLYSYKVDKHTGDVLPDIEDKHNHMVDALRYALAPLIKRGRQAVFR